MNADEHAPIVFELSDNYTIDMILKADKNKSDES